nr:uncharacterized protein LOC120963323 [Aegilops tauschii subsp. strangulata]
MSLSGQLIQLPPVNLPLKVSSNPKFMPYFEDCIRAIDGTHVPISISPRLQDPYRNRKGTLSQNVMVACNFDNQFVHVSAGWEGSASDARVLQDALENNLYVPEGKFYLVDAGYANTPIFIQAKCNQRPQNAKELFNLRHAQLRNHIERIIGVVKKRFPVLKCASHYPIESQPDIVIACCALHNFIRNYKGGEQWFDQPEQGLPKDPFAPPRIDQVIDSTASCELLSFLDAYSGYHPIKLDPADALKTSFIMPFEAYCYITTSFGLKNVGATFQRCMQKCLLPQIGQNVHVYVEDIVVKTKQHLTLLADLKETFTNLRQYQIKLNPEKCVFDVPSSQLLSLSQSAILRPIRRRSKPSNACASRLGCAMFRSTPTVWPLSAGSSHGQAEGPAPVSADEEDVGVRVERPGGRSILRPQAHALLVVPAEKEPLLLYITATSRVVSMVLVVERPEEGKAHPVQRPMYYLSKALSLFKQNYPYYQKMCYDMYLAAKKLTQYF